VRKFLLIAALDFISAVIIVAATRAYVAANYHQTAIWEVVFVTQWFKSRNMGVEDADARSWRFGYPANLLGSVLGTLAGLWISVHLGVR
jgi:hypothetical protein